MKTILLAAIFVSLAAVSPRAAEIPNPAIRYDQFLKLSHELEPVRAKHRVTEEEFIKMSAEPGTVILDARSKDRYDRIHVKGAVHLAFTDFTEEALGKVIPDKTTRILIYCNNNFENEPVNFARKSVAVALNVQTFVNLHAYGYTNVYELGPLLDVKTTRIPFEGIDVGNGENALIGEIFRQLRTPPKTIGFVMTSELADSHESQGYDWHIKDTKWGILLYPEYLRKELEPGKSYRVHGTFVSLGYGGFHVWANGVSEVK